MLVRMTELYESYRPEMNNIFSTFQITNLKRTIKSHLTELDEDFAMDYKESSSTTTSNAAIQDPRVKKTKTKIMKSSAGGKSWFKF